MLGAKKVYVIIQALLEKDAEQNKKESLYAKDTLLIDSRLGHRRVVSRCPS